MISVQNVSMRFASRVLFDDVTTTFSAGRRYGLTGPNGAGKSTFMKLLTGELQPQRGDVARPARIGVLKQDQFAFDRFRVIDTVIMGNERLWHALEERERLYVKEALTDEEGMRLGELEGIVGDEEGYTAESDAAILLQGLDISDELHARTMAQLQGGQKVRVLLAQALFGHPEALLLDEPTNHLDLDSIHWLREFLVRYEGTLIVISHDRHFLNAVCTHIADIDYETIITYTGGYDDMVIAKTQVRTRVESQNEQREKKIAQLQDFIARFSAGTRASQVMSRKKEVERLQTTELARSNIQRPYIKFAMNRPSGRVALDCSGVSKAFGGVQVLSDFGAIVNRGEKIVLVGRNGLGKTTLLKSLLAEDAGAVRWGHEVSIGYFPQDHTGEIEKALTAVDWLHRFDPDASRQDIHGLLGQMLFSGEEGLKPTEALSGGETARLLFCRIMLQKPNVLVLDEPTNHLDLESINALNIALQRYEGTILLVTHDEDLMEEVGTRVWHFDRGRIHDFKGTYEEYAASLIS
ncbi:MAG TPA: ATP-binding cassette domain-containing protein [Vicinamibacterales bacterium]|nr:ATP-binding cassette domain-containing protein [Vicinamibacterales bacterium]